MILISLSGKSHVVKTLRLVKVVLKNYTVHKSEQLYQSFIEHVIYKSSHQKLHTG